MGFLQFLTWILPGQAWMKDVTAGKKTKGDKLQFVDHSKIDYESFRRSFYIEPREIGKMSDEDVAEYRRSLDNLKVEFSRLGLGVLVGLGIWLLSKPVDTNN